MSVYLTVDVIKERERLRTGFNRLTIADNTCDTFLIALRNVIEIIGEQYAKECPCPQKYTLKYLGLEGCDVCKSLTNDSAVMIVMDGEKRLDQM